MAEASPSSASMAEVLNVSEVTALIRERANSSLRTAMSVSGLMKSSMLWVSASLPATLAVMATESTLRSESCVSTLKSRMDSISSPKRSMR